MCIKMCAEVKFLIAESCNYLILFCSLTGKIPEEAAAMSIVAPSNAYAGTLPHGVPATVVSVELIVLKLIILLRSIDLLWSTWSSDLF